MSYDIAIEVDASGAIVSIDKVARSLDGVEKEAKRAGDAATKATRETSLGAETAKRSTESLAKAFGGLNAELQREAAMLDRLRGPSLRYNEDLRVLDRLLDQNKISVAEYTAELTKMNRALEQSSIASNKVNLPNPKKMLGGAAKIAGTVMPSTSGLLSNVGAGLAMGGPMGLAIAAAPAIQELGAIAGRAADAGLTKLSNVLNASTIAARKANEAFIARMQILRTLVDEESKTADAVKATQDAMAAGVRLAGINEDVAMAATRARVALNAAFGVDLTTSMSEAERKARDFAGALKQLEDSDAAAKLARDVARVHQSLHGVSNLLRGQIDDWQDLTAKVDTYKKAIAELEKRRADAIAIAKSRGLDPKNFGIATRQDVDLARQLRDAQIQLEASTNVYGKTVADVKLKALAHRDAMNDLKGAYKAGEISASQYRKELAALGVEFSKLPEGFRSAIIGGVGVNVGMDRKVAAPAGPKTIWDPKGGTWDAPGELVTQDSSWLAGSAKSLSEMGLQGSEGTGEKALQASIEQLRTADELTRRLADSTNSWRDGLSQSRTILDGFKDGFDSLTIAMDPVNKAAETVTSAFRGLEDQIVSLVRTGKADFKSLADSIISDLTRVLIKELVILAVRTISAAMSGGGTTVMGAFTSGGFGDQAGAMAGALFGGNKAFGGDYRVGGSGGPDSQRVMFNLTPGEHVRFTPPGQTADASSRAGTPEVNVRVVNVTDPSEMIGAMDSADGERLVMNVIKRNMPALRGALTGR